MSEERRKMLKEMIEQSVNPVGWLGYHEGLLVSFLQTQEQVESFLKNTDTAGKVLLVYTHPMRELTDEEINEVFKSIYGHNNSYINSSLFKFARAILRKASEK
jgi:tRNA(Ser,Leu) C12 N-acetylase TAN1